MPVPLIGLAVVGTVATVSYLVPLIIACISGAITTITAFLAARRFYKKNSSDDIELVVLHAEQLKRERATRAGAEKTVERAGHHVDRILKRTQKQQNQLSQFLQRFSQNIENTGHATDHLERVAVSMEHAASATSITVEAIVSELEHLKAELVLVNKILKDTQDALAEKDAELKLTIDKLAAIEVTIATNIDDSAIHMTQFCEDLESAHSLLYQSDLETPLRDAEMAALRTKNARMTSTIKTLETTIERLTSKLTDSTDTNKAQLQDIRSLLDENKRLTRLIDNLSRTMEEQEDMATNIQSSTPHQIRMFRS